MERTTRSEQRYEAAASPTASTKATASTTPTLPTSAPRAAPTSTARRTKPPNMIRARFWFDATWVWMDGLAIPRPERHEDDRSPPGKVRIGGTLRSKGDEGWVTSSFGLHEIAR